MGLNCSSDNADNKMEQTKTVKTESKLPNTSMNKPAEMTVPAEVIAFEHRNPGQKEVQDGSFKTARAFYLNGMCAIDGAMLVADYESLRKLNFKTEQVQTVSKQAGIHHATGLAVNPANGDIYCTDVGSCKMFVSTKNFKVKQIGLDDKAREKGRSVIDGPFAKSDYYQPMCICYHPGTNCFYITDQHAVRCLDPQKEVVFTVAGTWDASGFADGDAVNARFNNLQGITVTNTGDLLVCDSGNNRLREYHFKNGAVSTFAEVKQPCGIETHHGTGAVFVSNQAQEGKGTVQRIYKGKTTTICTGHSIRNFTWFNNELYACTEIQVLKINTGLTDEDLKTTSTTSYSKTDQKDSETLATVFATLDIPGSFLANFENSELKLKDLEFYDRDVLGPLLPDEEARERLIKWIATRWPKTT
jgi:DNA-binding beta-propeller fold protein YncE